MPSKKKGPTRGKLKAPQKTALQLCNQSACANYLLYNQSAFANYLLLFWPNKYPRELGLRTFRPHTLDEGGRPWLESVINSPIASCIVSRSLLSRPGTRITGRTIFTWGRLWFFNFCLTVFPILCKALVFSNIYSLKWKWSCSVVSDSLRPHGL